MSSTRSLRSYPSRERRTRRSRWWVAAVSSAPARRSHGDGGGKNGQWPSPKARMARLGSRRGRGGHDRALVELWFAFLRRRAGASAAELARQQWRDVAAPLLCLGRAEEQRKMWHRGALGGMLGLQLPRSGLMWPSRSGHRRRVAPRGGEVL